MKRRLLTALLLAVLVCLSFAGCAQDNNPSDIPDDGPVVGPGSGGFDFAEAAGSLHEDEKNIFEKALGPSIGAKIEPLCLLGKQTVAGTNYAFLCKSTPVTENPVSTLVVMNVYADLAGNASVTNTRDFIPADVKASEGDAGLSGGWFAPDTATSYVLPNDIKTAFESAKAQLMGSDMEVCAYLGKQIVAGTNYLLICKMTPVTPDPVAKMSLVKLYVDLEGNASFGDMIEMDISELTKEVSD